MTALQKLLIPKKVKKKIRIFEGNKYGGDGGYVASADHLSNYLISLGCCGNTSFEESYLTKLKGEYKIDIYDGDGGCELAQKDPDITFFNKNVYSLNDFHIPDECLIQCDIEGSEISLFSDYNEKTKRIKQMCLEVHLNINKSVKEWINFFEIINSTHSLIHIHGNNNIQGYFQRVHKQTKITCLIR